MARFCTVRFLSAVRAVAARWKLPFALRPGLSQENEVCTNEITKERQRKGTKERRRPSPYSSPLDTMKSGVEEQWYLPPIAHLLSPRSQLLLPFPQLRL